MSLLTELKRRNVIRMAGLYLVGAWLITQVAGTVLPMFGAPEWVARSVVLLLAIGFVPALIFAWVFELTPEGLKRDAEVPLEHSIAPHTAKRMDRLIVAGLLAVIAMMAAERFWPRAERGSESLSGRNRSELEKVVAPESESDLVAAVSGTSIAVLPLANLSGDPTQDYFSDGMSEELLDGLSKVHGLRVAARTSSFQFKGRNTDIQEIATRLNVATVLEGSLRKSGNQIRITTQLIDGTTGFHLWSETYDRELDDIFAVQDEISAKVVEQLRAKLGLEVAGSQPTPTRVTNAEAYDAYLRGREALRERSPQSVAQGLVDLQRATELDPGYAPAWASLAEAVFYSRQATTGMGAMPIDEAITRGRAALAEAKRLNPELADVHAVEGLFQLYFDGDLSAAMVAVEAAIARNPSHAQALSIRSDLLNRFGRYAESLAQSIALAQIDPLYERNNREIVRALAMFGRFAEATPHLERVNRESTRVRIQSAPFSYAGEWEQATLGVVSNAEVLLGWFGGREMMSAHLIMLGLFDEAARAMPKEQGDLSDAARGDWARALEVFDGSGFSGYFKNRDQYPFFRRGQYLYRAGQTADAIEQFDRVKRVFPYGLADDFAYTSPRRVWYALALREVGRVDDAKRVEDVTRLDVAAARRDGIATPIVDLLSAELALWDGKPDEALPLLPRGLRADPFLSSIESDPIYAAVRDRADFKRAVADERARRVTMRASFLKQACAAPAEAKWRPLPTSCASVTSETARTP